MSTRPPIGFSHFKSPDHMESCAEEGPYYFVSAHCPVFGDDLIVATFGYDETAPDAEYYQQQALLMAQEFAKHMNAITS